MVHAKLKLDSLFPSLFPTHLPTHTHWHPSLCRDQLRGLSCCWSSYLWDCSPCPQTGSSTSHPHFSGCPFISSSSPSSLVRDFSRAVNIVRVLSSECCLCPTDTECEMSASWDCVCNVSWNVSWDWVKCQLRPVWIMVWYVQYVGGGVKYKLYLLLGSLGMSSHTFSL